MEKELIKSTKYQGMSIH